MVNSVVAEGHSSYDRGGCPSSFLISLTESLISEILFWIGIREGKLLALSLSDFDLSGNRLHISKTYNRIQKRDVIDTPKKENSVRTTDIPNFLKEEIQEYMKKRYGFPDNQRLPNVWIL